MKVESVRIENLWSFGTPGLDLRDLGDQTILIGKNNCGKSNILRGIRWFKENAQWLRGPSPKAPFGDNASYTGGANGVANNMNLRMKIRLADGEIDGILTASQINPHDERGVAVSNLLREPIVLAASAVWSGAQATQGACMFAGEDVDQPEVAPASARSTLDAKQLQGLKRAVVDLLPSCITYIRGGRSLADPGLIQELRKMQAPLVRDALLVVQWDRVTRFFRDLTGLRQAHLKVDDAMGLNVSNSPRYLPIQSFGDGIHHLLMLAFNFARQRDHVFLVEEPETHIHPELQRHLVSYIKSDDNRNQYIFTTHSPVLLDSLADAAIFRVVYDGETTATSRCETNRDLCKALDLLDVRASDILQANVVVWVEGPTDRMFINRCLALAAPDLCEGIHYQVVCYGGKLLRYLSASEESEEWVNIARLARHFVVVCDHDGKSPDELADSTQLNSTKLRLKKDCETANGMFWLTKGREIENYLNNRILSRTYRELMDDPTIEIELGSHECLNEKVSSRWGDLAKRKWRARYADHKARIMPLFLANLGNGDLDHLDLREQIDTLVKKIREANPPALMPKLPGA